MEAALEGGLGGQRVKMGAGAKTEGIAFQTSVIKRIVSLLVVVAVVMGAGMTWTYRESIQHRYNLYVERRESEMHRVKNEATVIASTLQLEAALALQVESKEEVIRLIRRIRGFATSRINDALAVVSDETERKKARTILSKIEKFIDNERTDFIEEFEEIAERRRSQMRKLHKSQTSALQKLLTRVTDVRLEALEEMLEDLFERMDDSIEVKLPTYKWPLLENLVDSLYQERLSLAEGIEQFDLDYKPFFEGPGLPQDLENKIHEAKSGGDLADVLDEIYEGVQFYNGRDQLRVIRSRWAAMREKADNPDLSKKEADKAEEEYIKSTVQAVIDVQELVNEGKVPEDFLDFDAIDLEEDDDDDDDDDDDVKSS